MREEKNCALFPYKKCKIKKTSTRIYKAENYKLNVSSFPECKVWQEYWSTAAAEEEGKVRVLNASDADDEPNRNLEKDLKESELIDNEERLKKVGLSEGLLEEYKAVGLLYKEICGDHGRVLWFRDTTDAKSIGITEKSPICEPFMGLIIAESFTFFTVILSLYAYYSSPTLFISSAEAVEGLALKIPMDAFLRFEKIGLYLPGICADYVPKAIDEFNSSSFEGVEIEGPIGVNISALEAAGVNLTALAEKLRNDTEVDEILSRTNGSTK
ncbi:unnamed protein product [Angiostrongylus costaricensis]|uniref:Uncharacterized protein n=1 Tax=Angiostrongylus costaricensis TaxID=334426 RepID=A0A3P7H4T9_ANGCS|nr:unnamed protein product [Angiostrongylus costaricensis]